jgi:signal peptidase I
VAAVLSLFCTGLGHIYGGQIAKGLVLFLVSLLFAPLVVVAAHLDPSTPLLVALLLSLVLVLGVYVYATVNAYRLARRSGAAYELHDYNHGLIYALFILVGVSYPAVVLSHLRAHDFEAFFIPSASESPNLLPGDRVLVNKVVLRHRPLQRGDVVVFRAPGDRLSLYVKRVIALPGDTVEVLSGRVHVNGKVLELDPIPRSTLGGAIQTAIEGQVYSESNAGNRYQVMLASSSTEKPIDDYPRQTVPADTCFVLGDNRLRSKDSRQFGFVPLGDLVGLVQYIYCPASAWSRFGVFRG